MAVISWLSYQDSHGNFFFGSLNSNLYDMARIAKLEDPRFRRFINNIFLIFTISAAALCAVRNAHASADETIKLDWGGYERQSDAFRPDKLTRLWWWGTGGKTP